MFPSTLTNVYENAEHSAVTHSFAKLPQLRGFWHWLSVCSASQRRKPVELCHAIFDHIAWVRIFQGDVIIKGRLAVPYLA